MKRENAFWTVLRDGVAVVVQWKSVRLLTKVSRYEPRPIKRASEVTKRKASIVGHYALTESVPRGELCLHLCQFAFLPVNLENKTCSLDCAYHKQCFTWTSITELWWWWLWWWEKEDLWVVYRGEASDFPQQQFRMSLTRNGDGWLFFPSTRIDCLN